MVLALQDIRLALRLLRRTPVVSAIALLSIALSVAATSIVFTAVKAVLLDPLPYADSSGLVQIATDFANAKQSSGDWVFWNDVQAFTARNRTLDSVAYFGNAVFDLSGDPSTPPEALYGLRVSANLFSTLGVAPMLGRNISSDDDRPGASNVILLSYGLWKRRFQADANIVGRDIRINGQGCTVIGVMPADFNFPLRRTAARTPYPYVEFWTPMQVDAVKPMEGALGSVARLRSGVSLDQARADIEAISSALRREFPATNRDRSHRIALLGDRALGRAASSLWFLMGATLLFLLIGCANVAHLLMARGLARAHEIAVRIAVGASRGRIVRQLLTESGVLAVLGGLAGFVLTVAAWRALPAIVPANIPRLAGASPDWPILGFALVLSVATGIVFGIVPALRSVRSGALNVRAESGGRDRVRSSLVIAEVAICVLLVVLGGQLLGSFLRLLRVDPGFHPDQVLASVVLPAEERYPAPRDRARVYRRFLAEVSALPGVEKAGTVDALPFSGENHGGFVAATEEEVLAPGPRNIAEVDVVGGQYLQALGVRLLDGRWFREDEVEPLKDVAIVDADAAERFWPKMSAVGQRLCVHCTPENPRNWKRVVGVVSTVRHSSLEGPAGATVYLAGNAFEQAAFLVVRTSRPHSGLSAAIRAAIARVDSEQPVLLMASMRSFLGDAIADRRFLMLLLTVTACIALLMSAAGIYGVTAYSTSRRTHEFGLRLALGATPGEVLSLVLRQGLLTVTAGIVIGLVLAAALLYVLRGELAGLDAASPASMALPTGLVLFTAALACWFPARRATRVEPLTALRHE